MKWRKIAALSLGDASLLVEAAVLVMLVNLRLRFRPYRQLEHLNHEHGTAAGGDMGDPPAKIAWAVNALSRRLPGNNTCLVQALAAHAMLRRRRYRSELRIGVAGTPATGGIKAHAWVECDGRIVVGELADLGSYAVLSPSVEPRG